MFDFLNLDTITYRAKQQGILYHYIQNPNTDLSRELLFIELG